MRNRSTPSLLVWILGAIIGYVFFIWNKPWHHALTYGGNAGLFVQPVTWLFIAIFVVAAVWASITLSEGSSSESNQAGVVIVLLIIVGPLYWIWSANAYGKAVANSYTFTPSSLLANTNVPRFTAYDIGNSGIQSYNNSALWDSGEIDPHLIGDEFVWQAPRIPLGVGNSFTAHSDKVFSFHEDETITTKDQSFSCGEGMWFGNSIDWALANYNYNATYGDHLYWTWDGKLVIVTPVIEWKWNFPVRYPVWGGVMVTDANCYTVWLSPEQAQAEPRLDGLQIFPEQLAVYQMEKWFYKYGNSFSPTFTKKEVYDIPELSEEGNQQPYLTSTMEIGLNWTFMADPTGNGDSLAKVFYINAETGQWTVVDIGQSYTDSFVGLQQGAQMIKNAFPSFSWDAVEGFIIIESLPVVKDGNPYWQYTITNAQKKDTVGVVLVNMRKAANQVVSFCSAASMKLWLHNEGSSEYLPCPQDIGAVAPQSETTVLPGEVGQGPAVDPAQYTDEELLDLLRRIMDELERRAKDAANAIIFWD